MGTRRQGDRETRKLLPHSLFPTPYSPPPPLRPTITSALIAAMRTAKLIITTVLALQLFVTTGLCGGVCCATEPDRTDHSDSAAEENYKPATEEKIESGHCPLHAAQEAKPNPQERKRHSLNITQSQAASHRRHHQTRSSSTVDAHFCACDVKRQESLFDALLQRSPEKRPAVQNLPGAPNSSHWLAEPSPSQIASPDPSRSHSPPFRGRQLHLRI